MCCANLVRPYKKVTGLFGNFVQMTEPLLAFPRLSGKLSLYGTPWQVGFQLGDFANHLARWQELVPEAENSCTRALFLSEKRSDPIFLSEKSYEPRGGNLFQKTPPSLSQMWLLLYSMLCSKCNLLALWCSMVQWRAREGFIQVAPPPVTVDGNSQKKLPLYPPHATPPLCCYWYPVKKPAWDISVLIPLYLYPPHASKKTSSRQ